MVSHGLQSFNLRERHCILLVCHLAHCAHRKWPSEAVVILACNCEPHVADIDPFLASILLELLGLLHRLCHVVMHKLDQLVDNVLFVVLDS